MNIILNCLSDLAIDVNVAISNVNQNIKTESNFDQGVTT